MKYIFQFCIILIVTFIGELLHAVIPLPIPASIYGLVLMLLCLIFKIIKLEQVEDTADFMIEFMPLMFVPIAVGLIDTWSTLSSIILPFIVIVFLTTVIVMVVTGKTAELVIYADEKRRKK